MARTLVACAPSASSVSSSSPPERSSCFAASASHPRRACSRSATSRRRSRSIGRCRPGSEACWSPAESCSSWAAAAGGHEPRGQQVGQLFADLRRHSAHSARASRELRPDRRARGAPGARASGWLRPARSALGHRDSLAPGDQRGRGDQPPVPARRRAHPAAAARERGRRIRPPRPGAPREGRVEAEADAGKARAAVGFPQEGSLIRGVSLRVFLTGATGYIGTVVAERLAEAGHHLSALARSDSAAARLSMAGVRPVPGDLDDPLVLARAAAAADGVITLATTYDAKVDGPAVDAILGALEGSGKPYLYTSGIWSQGDTGGTVVDETMPTQPFAHVAWRKPIEDRVRQAAQRQVRSVDIRPGMVYGRAGGIPAGFTESARKDGAARFVG